MSDSPYSGKDAKIYKAAVDKLVGDADPLDIMAGLYVELSRFFADKPTDKLNVREAEGKWSMRQVVDHMYDVDLLYGYRTRQIVTLDQPEFLTMDQDGWVAQNWYREVALDAMLSVFDSVRRVNIAFLRSLSDEQRQRFGVHSVRGKESVADLMVRWAGHDLVHYRQLDRIWEAVKG
ncbi:DinB family protein [bacterium]|nr:DinB family protein [bacterium]